MSKTTITIKDVAQRAGVSIATVSYVFNQSAPVSEATRAKVLQAATDLNYRPSTVARNLRAQESRTLGYSWHPLPADHWHPILDRFLYGMAQAAEAQNYHILTFTKGEQKNDWSAYQELLLTGRVDGFVLSNTNTDDARIRYLMKQGFPFAAFGQANPEWDFPYVDIDGQNGIYQAVTHLIELGHRRIGILAWPEHSLSGTHRYNGYLRAMLAHRLEPRPEWTVRCEHDVECAATAMGQLLTLPEAHRPTGVVCLSDMMAIGAMRAIIAAGLRPGRDIAVIGFDDIPTAQYFSPPLSSIRQPVVEAGELVINMLLQKIRGETLAERHVLLKPTLIVRESSGGPIG